MAVQRVEAGDASGGAATSGGDDRRDGWACDRRSVVLARYGKLSRVAAAPRLLVVAAVAAVAAAPAPQLHAAPLAQAPALAVVAAGGALMLLAPGGPTRVALPAAVASDPAWSPDGRRLAFVAERNGNAAISVLDVETSALRLLGAGSAPAWSRDGKAIAYTGGGDLWVMAADGRGKHRVVPSTGHDTEPMWEPDGRHILFSSDLDGTYDLWTVDLGNGVLEPVVRLRGDERRPRLSPDGRTIAFSESAAGGVDVYTAALDGSALRRRTTAPGFEGQPTWSPDGTAIAYTTAQGIWTMRRDGSEKRMLASARSGDAEPTWASAAVTRLLPLADELLPDLDQRAPTGFAVVHQGARFLLGFDSAVDNLGAGPLWIRGSRPSRSVPTMTAQQLVRLRGGGVRTYQGVGGLRYESHPPHHHWHFQPFERYELRRASDFALIVRDHKAGFCLADHWGLSARRVPAYTGPHFLGSCGTDETGLLAVEEGESPGFTDRYPALFHGQDVDVTGVPAGLYVLVQRANPAGLFKELRYDNDAASALIRLTWPGGRHKAPRVAVLARCDATATCRGASGL